MPIAAVSKADLIARSLQMIEEKKWTDDEIRKTLYAMSPKLAKEMGVPAPSVEISPISHEGSSMQIERELGQGRIFRNLERNERLK